jgi:ABC-type amino acid transport system permease subunit
MENEVKELKREMYKEIEALRRKQQSFMLRVGIVANLFLPGLGFVLLGKGLIKGIVSFVLYFGYWFFTLGILSGLADRLVWFYGGVPLLAILIGSTAMLPKE